MRQVVRERGLSLMDIESSEFAYGWPMPAFHVWNTNDRWRGGWPVGATGKNVTRQRIDVLEQRIIPYDPIWPGQVVNTLFYAGLLWLMLMGPGQLRRTLRRHRGLCPKCAYDLRGTDHERCPECGWDRESAIDRAE